MTITIDAHAVNTNWIFSGIEYRLVSVALSRFGKVSIPPEIEGQYVDPEDWADHDDELSPVVRMTNSLRIFRLSTSGTTARAGWYLTHVAHPRRSRCIALNDDDSTSALENHCTSLNPLISCRRIPFL
jgi:hypothetical protein